MQREGEIKMSDHEDKKLEESNKIDTDFEGVVGGVSTEVPIPALSATIVVAQQPAPTLSESAGNILSNVEKSINIVP
jgi:hypothetical protein